MEADTAGRLKEKRSLVFSGHWGVSWMLGVVKGTREIRCGIWVVISAEGCWVKKYMEVERRNVRLQKLRVKKKAGHARA